MTLTQRVLEAIAANPTLDSVQIGRLVGCRDAFVRAVARRRGLSFGPNKILTDAQRSAIMDSGQEPEEIAKQYGITVKYAKELLQPRRVPQHVLVDRRRRQEAWNNLSDTGKLMGDPPCPPCL